MSKRFVYILRSLKEPERRYVGLTSDVARRLDAHNAGVSPFTANYRPWAVTVCIEFVDEHGAAAFERYLKSPSGRAFAKRHFAVDHLPALPHPVSNSLASPSGNVAMEGTT